MGHFFNVLQKPENTQIALFQRLFNNFTKKYLLFLVKSIPTSRGYTLYPYFYAYITLLFIDYDIDITVLLLYDIILSLIHI